MDTAEPDEFARLLAQLNGAPAAAEQAPAAQVPAAQVPAQPAAPVAPAFGAVSPYPSGAAHAPAPAAAAPAPAPAAPAPASAVPPSIAFPTVPSAPADVAPSLPPLPRAPELMGADELAAPPRQLPPSYEQAPTLVAPPAFDAPIQPEPVQAAATPVQPAPTPAPAPMHAPAPAPTAAAVQPVPVPVRPLDFSTLLATPVGADVDARTAAPSVLLGSTSPEVDEADLARSTAGEKVGLVLAFLVAPIGLIVGIVAAARSANRRGWVVGIVRASIAISVVLTIALGIGGYYAYTQFKQQQLHDQTAAASAAFCSALKADPTMYQLPTFGWPAVAASIPDSLKAMQAYEDRWTKLAKVSPPGIKADVTKVATAAKKIIDSVTVARTIDDASNVAALSEVASNSGVPAWHSEYCG